MPNWIPRDLTSDIMAAVEAEDDSTWVFYITSAGGEGKTILLRQIGMKLGSPNGITPADGWSGILDLYHSDVNSNSGLENHLSTNLETDGKEFTAYREERDLFTARREAGLLGSELETGRERIAEIFAACLNTVTDKGRTVIALDTTERIQYERDAVQKACGLETDTTDVRAWLLQQLKLWQNCVVLLVGRPEDPDDPYLTQALEETLTEATGVTYRHETLGGFSEVEADAYFEQKENEVPELEFIEPEFRQRLYEVTAGSPIRLELAVEVVKRGFGFDKLKETVNQEPPEVARQAIDQVLIDSVMNDPSDELKPVLNYLAVTRKGLNMALLHHLSGRELTACQTLLQTTGDRGFVKMRPGDERLFLHDEMYLLCDTHLLQAHDVQTLSERIVTWYEEQIDDSEDSRKRQDLEIESLFYRLRADPQKGYHWYAKRADFAIRGVQAGLDMRLRSEMLTFLRSVSPIDTTLIANTEGLQAQFNCDSAGWWVKRLMVRGKNRQAVEIAQEACPTFCPEDKFVLAKADLTVYHAQAMIYSAESLEDVKEAVALLQKVIETLERDRRPEDLATQDSGTYQGWRRNLVLGRAHNNVGYAYWMYLGHYEAALQEFRSALPYFHASGLQEEQANTQDNIGRVFALRRHPTRAAALVGEGLVTRQKLGREYRVGLSLNSRAIVHLEFGEARDALQRSEQALGIFEGLNAQRGVGLALITLGRALRQMGGLWKEGAVLAKECDSYFTRGAETLTRAVRIFKEQVNEPLRLVEALNELGCVYRDRARMNIKTASNPLISRTIAVEAIKHLEACVELAQEQQLPVQYVDACEDLANTYFYRGHYDNAHHWLARAEERVPETYKFKKDQQQITLPRREEAIEAFWQEMGKIELLKGDLVWEQGTEESTRSPTRDILEQAIEHYVLASVYFEQYSGRDIGLQSVFRHAYLRFKFAQIEDLRYLQQAILPELAQAYAIDTARFASFFEDTLGISA